MINSKIKNRIEHFKSTLDAGKCDKCTKDAIYLAETYREAGFFCKEHIWLGEKEILRGTVNGGRG